MVRGEIQFGKDLYHHPHEIRDEVILKITFSKELIPWNILKMGHRVAKWHLFSLIFPFVPHHNTTQIH